MELRPYQAEIRDRVYEAWSRGARNVLATLATGGGKSLILSDIVKNENAPVCVIAHRQELVSQISLALARNGVYHRIIASKQVVGFCVQLHKQELGASFYHASGKVAVAGVQTLIRREDEVKHWAKTVTLWAQDECFPSGTSILMGDGTTKNIENIEVGDEVECFDEKLQKPVVRPVTELFKNLAPNRLIKIRSIHGAKVKCTPNHPIYIRDKGWVKAEDVELGDYLLTRGGWGERTDWEACAAWQEENIGIQYVYNFGVKEHHNYFADSILVHNCHHLLAENQWGSAAAMFPNARGLGVTATPCRADGKGLGRDADGVMDELVEGITMRELIDAGYLTEYRIFAPPSDIHLENVKVSSTTGDYSAPQLRKAVAQSHIHGDVVQHYLKLAAGKQGITFATDIEAAKEISRRFNEAGVPSDVITGKTPDGLRNELIRRFRTGQLTQLVNVDIFGEGFDLPALEVVSMARPTESYSLFAQQFGRALRPLEGKTHAIIIDHVGNTLRHGLPDAPRQWTLERRGRKDSKPQDVIPTKTCPECTGVFERIYKECPFCGFYPEPVNRSGPEHVDGDLLELDAETLKQMRSQVDRLKQDPDSMRKHLLNQGVKPPVAHSIANNHAKRKEAHDKLHEALSWWGAHQRHAGRPDSESYRRFFLKFGVDVLTAQTLSGPEALELADRVTDDYSGVG